MKMPKHECVPSNINCDVCALYHKFIRVSEELKKRIKDENYRSFQSKINYDSSPYLLPHAVSQIKPIKTVVREYLIHALKAHNNNLTKTCRTLKIHRTSFYKKTRL